MVKICKTQFKTITSFASCWWHWVGEWLHDVHQGKPKWLKELMKSTANIMAFGYSTTLRKTPALDTWKHKSGWWFEPLWKLLVNWDDYSQLNGKIKNVPNHQPEMGERFQLIHCFLGYLTPPLTSYLGLWSMYVALIPGCHKASVSPEL